ncbi:ribbon-helix-helix domain-containing protein [Amaricoccus solimangrovi]|uniref:Ribbon-helix-helix domain-containing protein n=1 Tax=Amaricoccus solimangrovi TaxID=2589815 RepID=A0A501WKB8_9RHOB|nr:ribbon-helix-helix domain-containing protein [Amaricoccus solimangrovi]TPE48830.1 ribbon-helix-helix domain-containing protein [Amaricoccus solimangrovi]
MCSIFSGQDPSEYTPETRRLRLNGQSTSLRLEAAFWHILDAMAADQGMSTPAFISKLHDEVLRQRGEAANFSSLLRCSCLLHVAGAGTPAYAAALAAE